MVKHVTDVKSTKLLIFMYLHLLSGRYEILGAEEGTRTPTPLRVRGPEPRASANSATSARCHCSDHFAEQGSNLESRKCGNWCQIHRFRVDRGLAPRSRIAPRLPRLTPASRRARSPCYSQTASKSGTLPWHPRQPCRTRPSSRQERLPSSSAQSWLPQTRCPSWPVSPPPASQSSPASIQRRPTARPGPSRSSSHAPPQSFPLASCRCLRLQNVLRRSTWRPSERRLLWRWCPCLPSVSLSKPHLPCLP